MKTLKRNILAGNEHNQLFGSANHTVAVVKSGFHKADDTIEYLVKKSIPQSANQTKKLADYLANKSPLIIERLKELFQFSVKYIQYVEDSPRAEQIKSPNFVWETRHIGCDCDCMTNFFGSVLYNWKVPFLIRKTDYGSGWAHVYPVALVNGKEIPMDWVYGIFGKEVPFNRKKDTPMIEYLNGLPKKSYNNRFDNLKKSEHVGLSLSDLDPTKAIKSVVNTVENVVDKLGDNAIGQGIRNARDVAKNLAAEFGGPKAQLILQAAESATSFKDMLKKGDINLVNLGTEIIDKTKERAVSYVSGKNPIAGSALKQIFEKTPNFVPTNEQYIEIVENPERFLKAEAERQEIERKKEAERREAERINAEILAFENSAEYKDFYDMVTKHPNTLDDWENNVNKVKNQYNNDFKAFARYTVYWHKSNNSYLWQGLNNHRLFMQFQATPDFTLFKKMVEDHYDMKNVWNRNEMNASWGQTPKQKYNNNYDAYLNEAAFWHQNNNSFLWVGFPNWKKIEADKFKPEYLLLAKVVANDPEVKKRWSDNVFVPEWKTTVREKYNNSYEAYINESVSWHWLNPNAPLSVKARGLSQKPDYEFSNITVSTDSTAKTAGGGMVGYIFVGALGLALAYNVFKSKKDKNLAGLDTKKTNKASKSTKVTRIITI